MSFFFKTKGRSIPSSATFRSTELGREELQKFNGDAKSRILMALETRGTCSVADIAATAHLSKGAVERTLYKLIDSGFVSVSSSGGGGNSYMEGTSD